MHSFCQGSNAIRIQGISKSLQAPDIVLDRFSDMSREARSFGLTGLHGVQRRRLRDGKLVKIVLKLTVHNLGAVLAAQKNCKKAEQHYRRALAIKEKLLDADSPDVALTRSNLGSLLSILGRRSESVPLLKSAITILEGQLTPAHPQLVLFA